MGIFRQFPYSNFHEMNMDEIIKIVKHMLEEWAQYYAEWDAWMAEINEDWSNYQEVMNEAWENMQDFINNYFDNLDVQNEINNKISAMVNSGEFDAIVQPYIPPRVTAWLTEHITQPVGVVIDTSLSVSGACADAKAAGDAIGDIQRELDYVQNDLYNPTGNAQIFNEFHSEIGELWAISDGTVSSNEVYRSFKIPINGNTNDVFSFKLYGDDASNIGITQLCCCVSNSNLEADDTALQRNNGNINYMRGGITLSQSAAYLYVMFTFDTASNAEQYITYLKSNLLVAKDILPQNLPSTYLPYYVYSITEEALSEDLQNKINDAYYVDEIENTTAIALTTYPGVYDNNNIYNSGVGINTSVNIDPDKKYLVSGYVYNPTQYPLFIEFDADNNIIRAEFAGATSSGAIHDFPYTPSKNANRITVNSNNVSNLGVSEVQYKTVSQAVKSHWQGKKIVWFGTSIPEGDLGANSYPYMISQITGATVYNESVGSSGVHCRLPSRVSVENPYGFMQSFKIASRCLGNSITEMQWLIDHYDLDIFTERYTAEEIAIYSDMILSRSYENKIGKYLTPETKPDLFVFDMGHNDQFNGSLTAENNLYNQYGQYSTFSFHGAMNMLIRYIREYDPYIPIVLIGEYTGIDTDFVPAMQLQVSSDWNMPICKDWEKLGWTKTKTITVYGEWELISGTNRYQWVSTESPNVMTMLARWLPDGIHPYTDGSNKALKHMANTITEWLNTIPLL